MIGRPLLVGLLRNDARLILRDRMLLTMLAMVVVMGLGCRFALPALDVALAQKGILPREPGGLRFADTTPVFVAFIALWQGALMPGTVFGFLLLDEKEDDTLTAMRVTPVPLRHYLGYRAALPMVLAFAFALALPPVIGLTQVAWWQQVLLALSASLAAPTTALLIAMAADDKVQGLAYTKFGGVAGLIILVGWFAPMPWQTLLGVFPPFWTCQAFWWAARGEPTWWLPLAGACAAQLGLLRWTLTRFRAMAFGEPAAVS